VPTVVAPRSGQLRGRPPTAISWRAARPRPRSSRFARAPHRLPLTWVFNVVGLLDLIHAFYQGLRHDVQLERVLHSTFIVPALVITHV